ncbi:HGE-14 family type IV secretion system effector [Anaplasma phagocytophilum]
MHMLTVCSSTHGFKYSYTAETSSAYKDIICAGIYTRVISPVDFSKILLCNIEALQQTLDRAFSLDPEFSSIAARVAAIKLLLITKNAGSSKDQTAEEAILAQVHGVFNLLYDALYACVTATCNSEPGRFISPTHTEHGLHLHAATAVALLVNIIMMCRYFVLVSTSQSPVTSEETSTRPVMDIKLAVNAYIDAVQSTTRRSCMLAEVPEEEIKAFSNAILHNSELLIRVSELLDEDGPFLHRSSTEHCLNTLLSTISRLSSTCSRLGTHINDGIVSSRRALSSESYIMLRSQINRYALRTLDHDALRMDSSLKNRNTNIVQDLVSGLGGLCLIRREYSSVSAEEHPYASRIVRCIRLIRDKVYSSIHASEMEDALSPSQSTNHAVQLHLSEAIAVLKCIRASLLLNPSITTELHETALNHLEKAERLWKSKHDVEQAHSSSDMETSGQESTSSILQDSLVTSPLQSNNESELIQPPQKRPRSL